MAKDLFQGATNVRSGQGTFGSAASKVPPVDPISATIAGVGVASNLAGGIYDFVEEAGKPKHLKDLDQQQWELMRQKMLLQLQEQKEAQRWRRGFMNRLMKGGSNAS